MLRKYLDELPVEKLEEYEADLLLELDNLHKDLLKDIADKKELTDDIKDRLDKVIKEFTERFKSSI